MKQNTIIEIISFLFILLFVYAGVSKLLDIEKFQVQIGQSPLLTDFASFIAWFIPLVEIWISIMLATPRFRFLGFLCAFSIMILFTGYIVSILQFSDEIPCSCGGVLQALGWKAHLLLNVVFVLLAFIGIVAQAKERNRKYRLCTSNE